MSTDPIEIEAITVRLPIDTHTRLRRQARREYVDKEEIIRKAIYAYLDREEAIYRESRYFHTALYPEEEGR